VIPFPETRERPPSVAASLLVKLAADLLKWQDPASAAADLLRFLVTSMRGIVLNHRTPLPTP
jgi:hypothetical protein